MCKKDVLKTLTVENLKREIRIQKSLDHPNVIKLYHYFEDKENVYLILEYACILNPILLKRENGSLFSYLRKMKKFSEGEAFIFFFQTCLGINFLHS